MSGGAMSGGAMSRGGGMSTRGAMSRGAMSSSGGGGGMRGGGGVSGEAVSGGRGLSGGGVGVVGRVAEREVVGGARVHGDKIVSAERGLRVREHGGQRFDAGVVAFEEVVVCVAARGGCGHAVGRGVVVFGGFRSGGRRGGAGGEGPGADGGRGEHGRSDFAGGAGR